MAIVAVVLGLAGLTVSAAGILVQVMPRRFSAAQQQQIISWEIGKRWRTWPAGKIFPAAIGYELPGSALDSSTGVRLQADRIGIARQAPCRSATDSAVGRALADHGCLTVLRATYEDATGALAVTVGVAVLPAPAQARASFRALPSRSGLRPGVKAVPFRRTLAARFSNAERQLSENLVTGPYVVMTTVGYADGRHRVHESADPYAKDEMLSVAEGIAHSVESGLGATPPPPHCPGGPGC